MKFSVFGHGRTRSITACSKPRFTRNQEMSNCPGDSAVCPQESTEISEKNAIFSF